VDSVLVVPFHDARHVLESASVVAEQVQPGHNAVPPGTILTATRVQPGGQSWTDKEPASDHPSIDGV